MGKPRRQLRRDLNGVLLFDKPQGLSSHQALLAVRLLFNADKAGHTGTLDPLATGLLPICFGQATKLTGHLLDASKRYRATVRLGIATRTGDSEGEVIAQSDPTGLVMAQLEAAAVACTGTIQQVPPMYSAIRVDGARLYELAREGVDIPREPRTVSVEAFDVVAFDGLQATLDIACSKGTYIRTLAEDWAKRFGQLAHVTALRRLAVGVFGAKTAVEMVDWPTLQAASDIASLDRHLLPTEVVVADWSVVEVDAEQAKRMDFGLPVAAEGVAGPVAMHLAGGGFLGLGELTVDGWLHPRRWFGATGL